MKNIKKLYLNIYNYYFIYKETNRIIDYFIMHMWWKKIMRFFERSILIVEGSDRYMFFLLYIYIYIILKAILDWLVWSSVDDFFYLVHPFEPSKPKFGLMNRLNWMVHYMFSVFFFHEREIVRWRNGTTAGWRSAVTRELLLLVRWLLVRIGVDMARERGKERK